MSLLQLLQQAQNGQGLSALAEQVGLDQTQAGDLTSLLAPVIGKAAKQQAESGGLDSILGALKGEAQAGMFDDVAQAASPEGAAQGANFLNGLLGDNGTNALAEQAAERTGIGMEQIMAFLPALGAMAQGGLQKQMPDASIDALQAAQSQGSSGGLMGLVGGLLGGNQQGGPDLSALTSLLDADGDGSVVDDIMAKLSK
ncbi:protein of unknown function [Aliiroseovarius halocynthiae]|uniref:DUF937 domain-containing protein n=1 Tax=Aliiroseovarius halocynthiae TaxID=985055 RepID=A0A545SRM8_9RHOB|nr:DUF937 domain-containing protein [Aliiroseovarius halocynthiae]TQV67556.1 DUF937 domain-containing protein [Aliiroseovarius halocynthiae]SMR81571.1 protein of unknown function [Aliiroseovarius halocynthiae]